MMDCVELVRDRAKRAERAFDSANSRIQSKAGDTINLFGGDATSRVADLARDARRACDDLYTSYQCLIHTLDETCRPLLSQDPDLSAVRAVRDLIKWLNDESETENNFTASFNGRDLGDVPSREDLTNQRISALIRQMIPDQIERVEDRRMAYFRLAE